MVVFGFEMHSLDDLMITQIRYRIASHMSVDAFGRKIGVGARQFTQYELESYQNTNSSSLRQILEALNTHIGDKVA